MYNRFRESVFRRCRTIKAFWEWSKERGKRKTDGIKRSAQIYSGSDQYRNSQNSSFTQEQHTAKVVYGDRGLHLADTFSSLASYVTSIGKER